MLIFFAAMVLSLFGIAAGALLFTAVPAVLDVSLVAFGLSMVSLLLWSALLARQRRAPTTRMVGYLALMILTGVAGYSAYLRFFSFSAQNMLVENGEITLSGTLYKPKSSAPFSAAVFVHGSGAESRHGYSYYAQRLARNGIAGFVYDKRGVGSSTGNIYSTDYAGLASDAAAIMRALRVRNDISGVGLIGYSEGEWTAPLAALMDGDAKFIIIIGPSGLTPAQQVNAEIKIRLRERGYSQEDITRAAALNNAVLAYQRTGVGGDELRVAIEGAHDEAWFKDAEDIPAEVYPPEDYEWWRSVMDFDPRIVWNRIVAPVLLLKGGDDNRSRADVAEREIKSALADGGNQDVSFVVYPGADHLLLLWPLGSQTPPPVFAPNYFEDISEFIDSSV